MWELPDTICLTSRRGDHVARVKLLPISDGQQTQATSRNPVLELPERAWPRLYFDFQNSGTTRFCLYGPLSLEQSCQQKLRAGQSSTSSVLCLILKDLNVCRFFQSIWLYDLTLGCFPQSSQKTSLISCQCGGWVVRANISVGLEAEAYHFLKTWPTNWCITDEFTSNYRTSWSLLPSPGWRDWLGGIVAICSFISYL